MKKFMKAIAFVTVMCLALSTVAFAANEDVAVDFEAKTLEITVKGAQKGEQVAIIVTNDGAGVTEENILFVDQKAAGAETAVFNANVSEASGETVDIYAGYASVGAAVLVAEDVSIVKEEEEEPAITITLADVEIVDGITEVDYDGKGSLNVTDAGTKGAVVKFTINVANTAADSFAGMFWGFKVKNDETEAIDERYFRAEDSIVSALNSGVLTGSVEIAAAINSTGYTVTDAKAVFSVKGVSDDVVLVEGATFTK